MCKFFFPVCVCVCVLASILADRTEAKPAPAFLTEQKLTTLHCEDCIINSLAQVGRVLVVQQEVDCDFSNSSLIARLSLSLIEFCTCFSSAD